MAKQVGSFEIIIRGSATEGPQQAFVRYHVEEATDPTLRGPMKERVLESPDFTKTFHDAGTTGEFWKDELAQSETDEGIS